MTTKRHALAIAIAALLAAPAAFAGPQDETKTAPPVRIKQPKPKPDKYKGRVLVFNRAQIMVQSTDNERMVWTFQFAIDLQPQVAEWLNSGGFQNGDLVEVYTNPGTTVAVKIKGKPSKPK